MVDWDDSGSFENLFFFASLSECIKEESISRWEVRRIMDPDRELRVASEGPVTADGLGFCREHSRMNFSCRSQLNFVMWPEFWVIKIASSRRL